jgi:hypothetical protein
MWSFVAVILLAMPLGLVVMSAFEGRNPIR